MLDHALTPQQLQVVSALSEGANMTNAAAQAGVHRNTIANWRRNYLPFGEALAHAQYDKAMLFREKAEDLVDLAFAAIEAIITDPKATPATRLKAAMFIVEMTSTPPAPKKQVMLDVVPVQPPAVEPATEMHNEVHKVAQSARPAPVQTIRREHPKVGRNEICPCGSGLKFKRCCLNKPQTAAAAQAA